MKQLLGAAILLAASLGFAQDASTENAARVALAKGEYAKVLEVYEPLITAGKPLTDVAHYRLAIAGSRLGQGRAAWLHLAEALTLNPQGSFATSPAKVADLRAAILAACESQGMSQCTQPASARPNSTLPSPAAVRASSVATAPTAPPSSPVHASTAPVASGARVEPVVAIRTANAASHAAKPSDSVARGNVFLPVAGILGWTLVAGWLLLRYRHRRVAGTDVLEALQDSTAKLLHRLAAARADNTALYRQLQALLPLLEQEVGRTQFRATGTTRKLTDEDQKAVSWAHHLTREPLDVLTASSHEIQALFQRRAV